jgi:hypothetical protein
MEIPVLVEPSPSGFRATTGAPLGLTADGPTADAALAALRTLIAQRLRAGVQVHGISVNGPLGPLTAAGVEAILQWVREHPLSEEHARAVEEYRREHNTIPDPDDEF